MYIEAVTFENNMPIAFDAYNVGRYHLHCHVGVLEVLIFIGGEAHVKIGFEEFDMCEGDYALIKDCDSHSIYATNGQCKIASLYFNIDDYKEMIPYLEYVTFACESFDLVKYKNETQHLRKMISRIILNLSKKDEAAMETAKLNAGKLLWSFVNDYDIKNYYSRNWDAGYIKTEKYYKIMKYIFDDYHMKNLKEHISKNEFYSQSYITHLFKEVSASSFQDVLTYIRLYRSEKMLLDSEIGIMEIGEYCGFSDIKYYTKNFKKWFKYTPSEYRKKFLPEVLSSSICQPLDVKTLQNKLQYFLNYDKDHTKYKAAINPLTAKNSNLNVDCFDHSNPEGVFDSQKKITIVKQPDYDKINIYYEGLSKEECIALLTQSLKKISQE